MYHRHSAFFFASAEHRREGGWYLALDVGNGTMKNASPYQNKFGEKTLSIMYCDNCRVNNRVYIIVYIFLIHLCVHLDMLNINEIIVHSQ